MALQPSNMTRSSSSDSSALSNIMVACPAEEDSASEHPAASTPPTSVNDSNSLGSAKVETDRLDVIEEETGRRPKRARTGVSTYNLTKLFDEQERAGSSRNPSGLTGRTLVDDHEDMFDSKGDKTAETDWEATESPHRRSPRQLQRRPSVKDRVKKAASKVGSVLGKRSREVMEAGKRKFRKEEAEAEADVEEHSPQQNKILKQLDMGTRGVLDEMNLSDDEFAVPPPRPAKRVKMSETASVPSKELTKLTAPLLNVTSGNRVKKWQKEGLYAGQNLELDPTQTGGRKKLQKKRPDSSSSENTGTMDATAPKHTFMTLPMFGYLDKTHDFIIPFDIYAPTWRKGDEKPKDWFKLNRNRLVGEAKDLWERVEKLPASACVCSPPAPGEQGCEDDCLNRVMQYECNDDNCNLPASQCSNRAFAELAARTKKGGSFDVGVEVIKTYSCGFGVRSCRTFAPGQIIMEYTGEIISEGECQRRMREEYKDKQCYYLMELERGLIIDGTKGSMARFINHSCAPNCEVRMTKVNGTPRMAVFAGEHGVMTGIELTYDYNFDNFGTTQQKCYCGAPSCRGTLSKRLNAVELKKLQKEEDAKRVKASQAAQKAVEAEAKKREAKNERGSSWRGWVAVDDPETKERLKAEKREKEDAEKNSSRARRMAARRGSLSGPVTEQKEQVAKKAIAKRRKTTHFEQQVEKTEEDDKKGEMSSDASFFETTKRKTHMRTTSSSSKFTEEFSHQTSAPNNTSAIVRKTEVSVDTTEVHHETHLFDHGGPAALSGAENDEVLEKLADSSKHPLSRTASKGKEVMKSLGQAVRNSVKGIDKSSTSAVGGGGKLKQSTLSFAKIN